jgi:thiamine-phosphate pyrophosphorylase
MMLSPLYFITDRQAGGKRSVPDLVKAALEGGLKLLQYREKTLSKREAFHVAQALRELTRSARAVFIINDDLDLAMAVEADGVHLGQEDLPLPVAREILGDRKIIGISVRDISAAQRAVHEGANYLAVGPLFESSTKQVCPPMGCRVIREIRKVTPLPLFGIGGIDPTNACEVLQAGADGVAVISSLHRASDITKATRQFLNLLVEYKKMQDRHPCSEKNS